ncbi:hypothetical protein ACIQUG_08195 [Ensifer sp. NPDC090286]
MIKLSSLAQNPVVAAFLARGERDTGNTYAVPTTPKPVLTGGEAVPA